jgi:hypothetical protein
MVLMKKEIAYSCLVRRNGIQLVDGMGVIRGGHRMQLGINTCNGVRKVDEAG